MYKDALHWLFTVILHPEHWPQLVQMLYGITCVLLLMFYYKVEFVMTFDVIYLKWLQEIPFMLLNRFFMGEAEQVWKSISASTSELTIVS